MLEPVTYRAKTLVVRPRYSKLRKDEKYLKYFMMYERKFKKTQSFRDFMEQDDEYPKEIWSQWRNLYEKVFLAVGNDTFSLNHQCNRKSLLRNRFT